MSRQRGQVLIILVATMLMGGGGVVLGTLATDESIDSVKSKLHAVVKDPAKSRAAQQALERWRDGAKDYFKAAKADHHALVELVKRHDATRAEFEAVSRRMEERDARMVTEFIATRETIRKQLTREEWAAIFKEPPQKKESHGK